MSQSRVTTLYLSILSAKPIYKIWLSKTSFWLTIRIILAFIVGIINTENKSAPRYMQYLGKNVMELSIISSKIPCLFIHKWPKIMG